MNTVTNTLMACHMAKHETINKEMGVAMYCPGFAYVTEYNLFYFSKMKYRVGS